LWLEPPGSHGRSHAYVTAHRSEGRGCRSRFAVRIDLPGEYSTKTEATPEAFDLARRFFHHQLMLPEIEIAKTVNDYRITARARFRIDCHAWEPVLWIKSKRPINNGAIQAFEGSESPFIERTFSTAMAAARFGFSYGERLVLGLISGLHV